MGFKCGIVGLPNVGKSTLFNALTAAAVPAENYPFCTVDPNVGMVEVRDERLQRVAAEFKPPKVTPTTLQFVDIAGLVKGASQGEGLGNQFLSHIGNVDAIAQVVRCFDDDNVTHVSGKVDPLGDIATIEAELCLRDLELVQKRLAPLAKLAKVGDKQAKANMGLLERLQAHLDDGQPARTFSVSEQEEEHLAELPLVSSKDVLYIANVGEDEIMDGAVGEAAQAVFDHAAASGAQAIRVCARLEADLASLPPDERPTFMAEFGLTASGLDQLIQAGYRLLGLITYFSGNENEVRAWTVPAGTLAPQAAGVIHTDFEKGFISAEVFACSDLDRLGSIRELRAHGLVHTHGREYAVQDGDVIRFRFNA